MADGGAMSEIGFTPTPDNARAFRDALGRFATGVTIVTIDGPTGPMGFTANSFTSLSIEPPLVLWSLARSSGRYPFFAAACHYAIHVLAAHQAELIERFQRSGAGFDGLEHDLGPQNVPRIRGALARFDCEQHTTYEGGDHLIVVGRVQRVVSADGAPLVFAMGQKGRFSAAL